MKQIILFLSLLLTVQIGTAQETWNACNSTVTVIPAPSYDSTFVLEAPSRAALQKGMANWVPASSGGGATPMVYMASLYQTGTSAPVATVVQNTTGYTISLSRIGIGIYKLSFNTPINEASLYGLGVFTRNMANSGNGIYYEVVYNDEDGDGVFIKSYIMDLPSGVITMSDDYLLSVIKLEIYQ